MEWKGIWREGEDEYMEGEDEYRGRRGKGIWREGEDEYMEGGISTGEGEGREGYIEGRGG